MWSAERIAQITGGNLRQIDPDKAITGFSIDSRTLHPNECFVAIPGKNVDGHSFISEAFERGASAALIEYGISDINGCNLVQVPNSLQALQGVASEYRKSFYIPIVGISGSSGKTTTKELLFHILSGTLNAYRSPGNYNSETGLPLALLAMPIDVEVGIFEVALQYPSDISTLARILKPTHGLITHVGEAHVGNFKNVQSIADEKWKLAESLPPDGSLVINGDSEYLTERSKSLQTDGLIRFGIDSADVDVRATEIEDRDLRGLRFELCHTTGSLEIQSQLLGKANIYAILGAASMALSLEIEEEVLQERIRTFRPLSGRMELIKSAQFGYIINDAYNANPDSMKAAIQAMDRFRTDLRKVLVIGDMLELGEQSERAHAQLADEISQSDIDCIFTIGNAAIAVRPAMDSMKGSGRQVIHTESQEELLAHLKALLTPDDSLVLIKGSRGMALDKVVDELR